MSFLWLVQNLECKHMFLARRVLGCGIGFHTRISRKDALYFEVIDAYIEEFGAGALSYTSGSGLVRDLELMIPLAKKFKELATSQQENCDNLAEHMASLRRSLERKETSCSSK